MTDIFSGFFHQLITGVCTTLEVAISALFLGLFLGILGASAECSRARVIRYTATTLISITRSLPELLVLFFIYFGGTLLLSTIAQRYVNVSAFLSGVIALGLIFGAYASQTFRGAFLAIPVGQLEAAQALGLTRQQIFIHIQLPQAWRHALPGLGNLWLVLLKDTALVSLIGLADLMNKAQLAASTTHQPFTFYLAAAFLYLFMTSISQAAMHKLTEKTNSHLAT